MLIAVDQIWHEGRLQPGFAIETDGETIVALRPAGDRSEKRIPVLIPGLTDLQVNGGGGVLFNTDPTPQGIETILAAHHRLGTVRILPTLITDAPEVMEAAADALLAAWGRPGIAGIHLEGPHIAPERRGTHDARFIRPLDCRSVELMRRLRRAGVPVLLTLAPERCDPVLMRELRGLGVILSAGHSTATGPEARQALSQGVTMFTHLFNAMPPLLSREPGIVGAAILSDAYCGLIGDGIHVSADAMRIAMAARPLPDRCFLVSDAMPTVGGPDRFQLYGNEIRVRDGALYNREGALAGAHLDLLTALRRLVRLTGIDRDRAIAMATDIPARAMDLPPIQIAPGTPLRDLIALDADLNLLAGALAR